MKTILPFVLRTWCFVLSGLLLAPASLAYPPAPFHTIYGMVRDEYGTPMIATDGQIMLQTSTGVQLVGSIIPGRVFGVNYQVQVPMDSGLTPTPYKATALKKAAPFKVLVVIDGITYVPIQMTGNYSLLGQPGKQTRIDLTLGEDNNGNGIPDAWEYAFLAALGWDPTFLPNLDANADYAQDGRTLRQEFLLGNYPFNTLGTFDVKLIGFNGNEPVLECMTMAGRSYMVLGSADLQQWTPLSFRLPAEGANGPAYSFFYADQIGTLQMQAIQPATQPQMRFFRVLLQ